MRAVTVTPGRADSLQVAQVPDPIPGEGELLVHGLALGVCGTDREIAQGRYGWSPPGSTRLILGHESLGRVEETPPGSGFAIGDLVAGVVRRPDPVPCGACAVGEFDMCRNGRYTERGIKELDGFGSELWCVPPQYAVRVDDGLESVGILVEPASVLAKAWEQVQYVGERSWFHPKVALVTGAGTIGLIAALFGTQRGLDVHVLDRVADGPKPRLVRRLGATYHTGDAGEVAARVAPDVVIEATGVGQLVFDAMTGTRRFGIACLTGVSPAGRELKVDAGAMNRSIVLENDAVIGSVNANLRHYAQAVEALTRADIGWLEGLITRRVPLDRLSEAFDPQPDDVKVIIGLE